MLVEADRLVVIPVQQSLAMELRLINEARQMDVTAKAVIRTAGEQLCLHSAQDSGRAQWRNKTGRQNGFGLRRRRFLSGQELRLSEATAADH